jgi:hypothetical protein
VGIVKEKKKERVANYMQGEEGKDFSNFEK